MDPFLSAALTALVPKVGVLGSIIWKMLADPAAFDGARATFETLASYVEKSTEVVTGTKEILDHKSPEQVALDQAILERLKKEFSNLTQNPGFTADQANQIASAVEDALAFLSMQPLNQATWLKARLSPEKLAEHLVQDCEISVPSFKGNTYARQVMQAVCETAFDELAKNQPAANKAVLGALGAVLDGQEQDTQKLDQVLQSNARIEALLVQKAQESGVSPRIFDPLRKLLAEEGEGISEEKLVQKIQEAIEGHRKQIKSLEGQIERLSQGTSVIRLKAKDLLVEALALVKVDDTERYMPLLQEVKALMVQAKQEEAFELASVNENLAMGFAAQYDYLTAAELYEEAAEEVCFDKKLWFKYFSDRLNILLKQGDEKGDNSALVLAIASARQILSVISRQEEPEDWATTQDILGNALRTLGARESGSDRLKEAVKAFQEALKERTRERAPSKWMATQANLGNALLALGERDSDVQTLQMAEAAYCAALQERSSEVELGWVTLLNNLGVALVTLGQRSSDTLRLEYAEAAYREALNECSRERMPLDWAMTKDNLGSVLVIMGEREPGLTRLEEAVDVYREALEVRTQARTPLSWAATQNNLGNALQVLGEREHGTASLLEASKAYYEALKERTRTRVPLDWAGTQNNLGNTLALLGERGHGEAYLKQALSAYQEALKERTHERVPLDWAATQNNLGNALLSLAACESSRARFGEAVDAFREALAVFKAAGATHLVEQTLSNLLRANRLIAALPQL